MKHITIILTTAILLLLLSTCTKTPQQQDYLGVYRIIKVLQGGESIETRTLNHIELTESYYITRIDRNNDNKFSEDEVTTSTYLFSVDEKNQPNIQVTGNLFTVTLLPDNYYDLLFRRTDNEGIVTTLYTKKVRGNN